MSSRLRLRPLGAELPGSSCDSVSPWPWAPPPAGTNSHSLAGLLPQEGGGQRVEGGGHWRVLPSCPSPDHQAPGDEVGSVTACHPPAAVELLTVMTLSPCRFRVRCGPP